MDKNIKEFIEQYHVKFGWIDKNNLGVIDNQQEIVVINLYLLIAVTFMHEYCHFLYPNKDEEFVETKAMRKIDRMKITEIKEIVDYIFALMGDDKGERRDGHA